MANSSVIAQTRVFTHESVGKAVRSVGKAGISSTGAKSIRDLNVELFNRLIETIDVARNPGQQTMVRRIKGPDGVVKKKVIQRKKPKRITVDNVFMAAGLLGSGSVAMIPAFGNNGEQFDDAGWLVQDPLAHVRSVVFKYRKLKQEAAASKVDKGLVEAVGAAKARAADALLESSVKKDASGKVVAVKTKALKEAVTAVKA